MCDSECVCVCVCVFVWNEEGIGLIERKKWNG